MKLAGSILLILSSTVMGYMVSHKLLIRVRFFQQYMQFISYIETEIRYSKRLIYEIIKNYANENEFTDFLTNVCANVENGITFEKAWRNAVYQLPASYGLLIQDKELISEFGEKLGKTDMQGQVAHCKLNKDLANSILEDAKEEKNKKSKLYFMLGTSFGICITIMLL